jgi:hypothetical protein
MMRSVWASIGRSFSGGHPVAPHNHQADPPRDAAPGRHHPTRYARHRERSRVHQAREEAKAAAEARAALSSRRPAGTGSCTEAIREIFAFCPPAVSKEKRTALGHAVARAGR